MKVKQSLNSPGHREPSVPQEAVPILQERLDQFQVKSRVQVDHETSERRLPGYRVQDMPLVGFRLCSQLRLSLFHGEFLREALLHTSLFHQREEAHQEADLQHPHQPRLRRALFLFQVHQRPNLVSLERSFAQI